MCNFHAIIIEDRDIDNFMVDTALQYLVLVCFMCPPPANSTWNVTRSKTAACQLKKAPNYMVTVLFWRENIRSLE